MSFFYVQLPDAFSGHTLEKLSCTFVCLNPGKPAAQIVKTHFCAYKKDLFGPLDILSDKFSDVLASVRH